MGPEFLVGGNNLHHIHRLSPGILLDIKDIPQGCACIITISFFDITTSYFCNSKLIYPNDIALLMIMNLIYTDWFADYLLQKKKTVTRIPRFVIFVIQSHKMLANLANSDWPPNIQFSLLPLFANHKLPNHRFTQHKTFLYLQQNLYFQITLYTEYTCKPHKKITHLTTRPLFYHSKLLPR